MSEALKALSTGLHRTMTQRITHGLAALLPAECTLCRLPSGPGDWQRTEATTPCVALCTGCREDLPRLRSPCPVCALPQALALDGPCTHCQAQPPPWDGAIAPLAYDYPVDRLVQAFKFQRDTVAGRALVEAMLWPCPLPSLPVEAVMVPVPLHRWRYLRRGFNQAAVIAARLARRTGHRLLVSKLVRCRATRAQSGLDAAARRRNLSNAFKWRGPSLAGQGVLLVDDVMTTGSTLAACTRVLKRAGAGDVVAWCAARAVDH